ncbi:hypothetical protein BJ166DRAFT_592393 [Pestalotiopsis sp. NC0098]|nr:hypothetical protein BJ166DRAFT_592393 [Pestalotiopsis sp. NC0098]
MANPPVEQPSSHGPSQQLDVHQTISPGPSHQLDVEQPSSHGPSQQIDVHQTICTTGDLFLVVGKQKLRFRVHSQCLQLASSVFQAKFLLVWSEGQNPLEEQPKDISLGNDDSSAMWTICCVLHHRNDLVPLELPAEEVLQIAVVSDKYNLSCALKHVQETWLTKALETDTMKGAARLLAAARLFRNAPSYRL